MDNLNLSGNMTPNSSQIFIPSVSDITSPQILYNSKNSCTHIPTEIGSEFWNVPLSEGYNIFLDANTQFVMSGRTALDLSARDLITERKIDSICLPAYCCDSMITPFKRMGLKIRFYDVQPADNGIQRKLSPNHGCDAVLLLDYFGFAQEETVELARHEHLHGVAVILDQVQSQFSSTAAVQFADYTITSWRKWFFSCGAAVTKHSNAWAITPTKPANIQYVSLRKKAAELKASYLQNGTGEKATFLNGFSQAEQLLDIDFSDYSADPESIDVMHHLNIPLLKQNRHNNAAIIYNALLMLEDKRIKPLFPPPNKTDTPLFVPVLVDPTIRMDLRQFLIKNNVYCPIHWPNVRTGGSETLYAKELSLICDQRYTKEDIEREMDLIKEFFTHYV